jgi:NADH:ubiquinone oxidoreductase subunit C
MEEDDMMEEGWFTHPIKKNFEIKERSFYQIKEKKKKRKEIRFSKINVLYHNSLKK